MKPWNRWLVVNVYERHRAHPWDELFFVGFEHASANNPNGHRLVLLGGIPGHRYFESATFVPRGGRLNPQVIAENDVWNLKTSLLEPPLSWLTRVTHSSAKSVRSAV
jgi:hypothetical protein